MSLTRPPSRRHLKHQSRRLRRLRKLRRLRRRLRSRLSKRGRPFRSWWIRRATPEWADREAIAEIYNIAVRRTRKTGVKHSVDHDIPLRGKYVCGLHIAENLRVMVATENCTKGNWHDSEENNAVDKVELKLYS